MADLRAGRGERRLRHAHLRIRGIPRGFLGIDLGLGHEAAALKRDRALVIRLCERRIGFRRLDLGGELRRLFSLHGAVDDGEHLPGAHPAPRIDDDADHASALPGDSDRLVALGCERTARADHASDLRLARDDDRHRRDLPGGLASRLLRIRLGSAAPERHDRPD